MREIFLLYSAETRIIYVSALIKVLSYMYFGIFWITFILCKNYPTHISNWSYLGGVIVLMLRCIYTITTPKYYIDIHQYILSRNIKWNNHRWPRKKPNRTTLWKSHKNYLLFQRPMCEQIKNSLAQVNYSLTTNSIQFQSNSLFTGHQYRSILIPMPHFLLYIPNSKVIKLSSPFCFISSHRR